MTNNFEAVLSEVYMSEKSCLLRTVAKAGVPCDEAEDVVEEAFVKAIRDGARFTGAEAMEYLRSWLRKVVHHRIVDAKRRRKNHPTESLDAAEIDSIDEAECQDLESAEREEQLTVLLERSRAINEVSHRLVREHYLMDRSIKEIAAEMGVSEDAIDARIRRHLHKLRQRADNDAR